MIRKFFTLIGSILLMLLLAVIALPFLFPIENYRSDILKLVQEKTGRPVAIDGDLSLTLLPNIALTVNDMTIGNPEGFVSPYFAKIGTLDLKVALWPLLDRQVEVNELGISNGEIYLEEAVGSKKNWEFTLADTRKMSDPAPAADKPKFKMDVQAISVEKTTLNYLKPGQKFTSENIKLDYSQNKTKLDMVMKHAGTSYHITANTEDTKTLFGAAKTPLSLAMRSPLIKADFAGDVDGIDVSAGKFDARVAGTLVAELLTIGKINSRKFAADMKKASLGILSIETGMGVSGTGDMVVDYSGKKPQITTTLSIPHLDLDRLLPDKEQKQSFLPSLIAEAYAMEPWSRDPIDFSMLGVVNADAKLSVGKLITSGFEFSEVASQLKLASSKLNINSFSAGLLGGKISGNGTVDANGQWNDTINLSGIPFDKLAVKYLDKVSITGTTNGSISFSGYGKSVSDWMNTLSGGGNITIGNGVIKGYSLSNLFRKTATALGGVVESQEGLTTPFSAITVAFSADKGVLNLREGSLKGDRLRAQTTGTVSLPMQSVNLVLTPELLPPPTAVEEGQQPPAMKGLMVPVIVKGPFDNITVKPDYSRTIGNVINDVLKDPTNLEGLKQQGKALEDVFEPSKGVIKQNWKDLKKTKDPAALNNILKEMNDNGVNPLNSLGGLGGALGGIINNAATLSEQKKQQELQQQQQQAPTPAPAEQPAAAPAAEPAPAAVDGQ